LKRLLITVPSLLAVAYFALWGCSRLGTVGTVSRTPPAPGMMEGRHGLGVAGSALAPISDEGQHDTFASGHFSYSYRWGNVGQVRRQMRRTGDETGRAWYFDFGTIISGIGGQQERFFLPVGLGITMRGGRVFNDRFSIGGEISGGAVWAEFALPFAARLNDRVSLYTSPALLITLGVVRLPLGVVVAVSRHFALTVEGMMGLPVIDGSALDALAGGSFGLLWRL